VKLGVERTRYEASCAERAFHHCDPDNPLVARSLERRWEEKLRDLAEAERELACQMNEPDLPHTQSSRLSPPAAMGRAHNLGEGKKTSATPTRW